MIQVTASNPIWIAFVYALASFAIASFWPRLHAWARRAASGMGMGALCFGTWIVASNAWHGCYPIWTGLTPAVVEYAGNMTVCPGQTVVVPWEAIMPYLPALPGPMPPSGIEREEPGRGI